MTIDELTQLSPLRRKEELAKCCGSSVWVRNMAAHFPFADKRSMLQTADKIWTDLTEADWLEAFSHHPKIGDVASLKEKFEATAKWAAGEQASMQQASSETLEALAKGNQDYEDRFGFIFIVCATGRPADEMLGLLQSRLSNERKTELKIAAAEQAKITRLRLEKLLL